MDNGRYSLVDMLNHQPDLLADAKIKVMISDIYDNIVSYVDQENAAQSSRIIADYGVKNFIAWFIDEIYLPKVADVKAMSYVSQHKDEICDILEQAMSNLTAEEALENANTEKIEGDGENEEPTSEAEKQLASAIIRGEDVVQKEVELKDGHTVEMGALSKASSFIDSLFKE